MLGIPANEESPIDRYERIFVGDDFEFLRTLLIQRLIPWLTTIIGKQVRVIAKRDALKVEDFSEARYFGCDYRTLMYEVLPEMKGESRALFLFDLYAIQLCKKPVKTGGIVLLDGGWTLNT